MENQQPSKWRVKMKVDYYKREEISSEQGSNPKQKREKLLNREITKMFLRHSEEGEINKFTHITNFFFQSLVI